MMEKTSTERVEKLWSNLDPKRKGSLDLTALKQGLQRVNHPLKDADAFIQEMLRACDLNNDGFVSRDEFMRFCAQAEQQLWSLFCSIDRDNSGTLDRSELKHAFHTAGIKISNARLDSLLNSIDKNNDGRIDFDEWRDYLLFIPTNSPGMAAVLNFYNNTVKFTAEGDVHLSDEALSGFGYFIAGGLSGITSRTLTAPLDRLKVYLIAQTGNAEDAIQAAKSGNAVKATAHGMATLVNACKELWAAGGIRSLFAGNGLNVVKVMPESAVKFGSYEACKRAVARFEGHSDVKNISPVSQFLAGGVAGMISQAVVYPLDTLKFRMQCETVAGGEHGNRLIVDTAKNMWNRNGALSFYRGLPMGLVGMFPYAALDLFTFESLKKTAVKRRMNKYGFDHEEDALPGNFTLALMGGLSGAFSSSIVYPINLLRTRLQTQGTASHQRTYTGIVDVTRQTIRCEGVRGLFKGLTPNLLKVVPSVSITYVVYENTKRALHLG
ncbi:mitochondrial carrier [Piedraia hortae CBS 480.64]|uniref:Mitochondrial thiamine pyrophosphate carrier 1 n=1 Tax=Piedraia hortae CBS 480.64 TaxID=1314780 RepID=A0A6A7C386_9PEZI|nr:mitochondrial carrier [Piedraia hortae CBS 480.64]